MNPIVLELLSKVAQAGLTLALDELGIVFSDLLAGKTASQAFTDAGMRLAEKEALALDNVTAPKG